MVFFQACIVITNHVFLSKAYINPHSKMAAVYTWVLLSPLWTTLARASDLLIVCMTVDRYKVMQNIDQVLIIQNK